MVGELSGGWKADGRSDGDSDSDSGSTGPSSLLVDRIGS